MIQLVVPLLHLLLTIYGPVVTASAGQSHLGETIQAAVDADRTLPFMV
jgi:hypothetical protein